MAANHLCELIGPHHFIPLIRRVTKIVRANGIEFDTIACCGTSGVACGPMLAAVMKKSIAIVRKACDDMAHTSERVEFMAAHGNRDYSLKRYLFVDDMIASGKTFAHVYECIKTYDAGATCVGIALHQSTRKEPWGMYRLGRRSEFQVIGCGTPG